jgi:hypothetical protein
MKSSSLLLALVTSLALGSSAYAAGQARSQGAAGAGARSGTATATHAQLHTPGTALTDPTVVPARPATAGGPKGIHTPGTGLTTTTN